jgi:sugar-specific transcriptional regulator TrmB
MMIKAKIHSKDYKFGSDELLVNPFKSDGMLQQDDVVNELLDFGLTVNQAKVYLSIVQSGPTSASKISEATHLHRQDIYKILPKLEKMGLITKTLGKPIMLQAIPVDTALEHLVAIETKKADDKISHLEAELKELTNVITDQQATGKTQEEERWLIPLTTDAEIANTAHLTFEHTRIEYDLVTTPELVTRMQEHLREHLRTLVKRGAKIRIIVENPNDENLVKRILKKIKPKGGNFAAKLVYKNISVPYQIFDNKELWIGMKRVTESGLPCALWTNGRNMVQFFKESFEETWNNHAASIYPKRYDLEKNN